MLYWIIDSRKRLVTHTAEGDLTRGDLMAYFDAVTGADAWTWRKLFDARRCTPAMSPEDLMAIGVRIRTQHARGVTGPIAIVLPETDSETFTRLLGFIATDRRPARVFRTLDPARQWIETQQIDAA
ncbi:hypothetical protein [Reyranella massiliensis]|uniref:hypothetical protein n=1 Tax=Reyranella massiliensis TaxID=445220 RepID=UPI0005C28646|nr:hypothetical protein [Reyranella massiliensis]